MKLRTTCLITALSLSTPMFASAAISIVAGTTAGPHFFLGRVGAGGSKWNTIPAGASANVYWDSDNNGVFGETAKGENSGNGAGTLGFTINIIDGTSYYFAVEGFPNPGTNQGVDFDLHNTDSSIQRLQVISGNTVTFSDSNGDQWEASYTFTEQGYGDVVSNVSSNPGGASNDHQGVLTFNAVPEPSSTALLGLGSLAMLIRRRR